MFKQNIKKKKKTSLDATTSSLIPLELSSSKQTFQAHDLHSLHSLPPSHSFLKTSSTRFSHPPLHMKFPRRHSLFQMQWPMPKAHITWQCYIIMWNIPVASLGLLLPHHLPLLDCHRSSSTHLHVLEIMEHGRLCPQMTSLPCLHSVPTEWRHLASWLKMPSIC